MDAKMMDMEFENPFSNYGSVVHGDYFIGREYALKEVEKRLIKPKNPGNLAVIGLPRIGKSSLAYKSLIEKKDELASKRIVAIHISVYIYDKVEDFFNSLVTQCLNRIDELRWTTVSIYKAYEQVLEKDISWGERCSRVQDFFAQVKEQGIRVIFILDEFDSSRFLFKDRINAFQALRELSNNPESKVSYLTLSRRSIKEIEVQTGAISTLQGIFRDYYLSEFHEEDLDGYYKRFESIGIILEDSQKDRIKYYCGKNPFLLETIGYQIIEDFREENPIDVDMSMKEVDQSFVGHFDLLIKLLEEEGILNKLLQIIFGPVMDANETDASLLMKRSILTEEASGYTMFSEYFKDYLRIIWRNTDLWPLWRDTERILRNMIVRVLTERYGIDWEAEVESNNPKLKRIFEDCRAMQKREMGSFGSRASQNLIDFTYPRDLFAIIFSEWDIFKDILGNNKNYWDKRSQILSKARTPLAHNREGLLTELEMKVAEEYCREIINLLG